MHVEVLGARSDASLYEVERLATVDIRFPTHSNSGR